MFTHARYGDDTFGSGTKTSRYKQSSDVFIFRFHLGMKTCGHAMASRVALKSPWIIFGTGLAYRNSPTGGSAYGMRVKAATLLRKSGSWWGWTWSRFPWKTAVDVLAIGSSRMSSDDNPGAIDKHTIIEKMNSKWWFVRVAHCAFSEKPYGFFDRTWNVGIL